VSGPRCFAGKTDSVWLARTRVSLYSVSPWTPLPSVPRLMSSSRRITTPDPYDDPPHPWPSEHGKPPPLSDVAPTLIQYHNRTCPSLSTLYRCFFRLPSRSADFSSPLFFFRQGSPPFSAEQDPPLLLSYWAFGALPLLHVSDAPRPARDALSGCLSSELLLSLSFSP